MTTSTKKPSDKKIAKIAESMIFDLFRVWSGVVSIDRVVARHRSGEPVTRCDHHSHDIANRLSLAGIDATDVNIERVRVEYSSQLSSALDRI